MNSSNTNFAVENFSVLEDFTAAKENGTMIKTEYLNADDAELLIDVNSLGSLAASSDGYLRGSEHLTNIPSWFRKLSAENENLKKQNKELTQEKNNQDSELAEYSQKLTELMNQLVTTELEFEKVNEKLKKTEKEKTRLKSQTIQLKAKVSKHDNRKFKKCNNDEKIAKLQNELTQKIISMKRLQRTVVTCRSQLSAKNKLIRKMQCHISRNWNSLVEFGDVLANAELLSSQQKCNLLKEYKEYLSFKILPKEGEIDVCKVLNALPTTPVSSTDTLNRLAVESSPPIFLSLGDEMSSENRFNSSQDVIAGFDKIQTTIKNKDQVQQNNSFSPYSPNIQKETTIFDIPLSFVLSPLPRQKLLNAESLKEVQSSCEMRALKDTDTVNEKPLEPNQCTVTDAQFSAVTSSDDLSNEDDPSLRNFDPTIKQQNEAPAGNAVSNITNLVVKSLSEDLYLSEDSCDAPSVTNKLKQHVSVENRSTNLVDKTILSMKSVKVKDVKHLASDDLTPSLNVNSELRQQMCSKYLPSTPPHNVTPSMEKQNKSLDLNLLNVIESTIEKCTDTHILSDIEKKTPFKSPDVHCQVDNENFNVEPVEHDLFFNKKSSTSRQSLNFSQIDFPACSTPNSACIQGRFEFIKDVPISAKITLVSNSDLSNQILLNNESSPGKSDQKLSSVNCSQPCTSLDQSSTDYNCSKQLPDATTIPELVNNDGDLLDPDVMLNKPQSELCTLSAKRCHDGTVKLGFNITKSCTIRLNPKNYNVSCIFESFEDGSQYETPSLNNAQSVPTSLHNSQPVVQNKSSKQRSVNQFPENEIYKLTEEDVPLSILEKNSVTVNSNSIFHSNHDSQFKKFTPELDIINQNVASTIADMHTNANDECHENNTTTEHVKFLPKINYDSLDTTRQSKSKNSNLLNSFENEKYIHDLQKNKCKKGRNAKSPMNNRTSILLSKEHKMSQTFPRTYSSLPAKNNSYQKKVLLSNKLSLKKRNSLKLISELNSQEKIALTHSTSIMHVNKNNFNLMFDKFDSSLKDDSIDYNDPYTLFSSSLLEGNIPVSIFEDVLLKLSTDFAELVDSNQSASKYMDASITDVLNNHHDLVIDEKKISQNNENPSNLNDTCPSVSNQLTDHISPIPVTFEKLTAELIQESIERMKSNQNISTHLTPSIKDVPINRHDLVLDKDDTSFKSFEGALKVSVTHAPKNSNKLRENITSTPNTFENILTGYVKNVELELNQNQSNSVELVKNNLNLSRSFESILTEHIKEFELLEGNPNPSTAVLVTKINTKPSLECQEDDDSLHIPENKCNLLPVDDTTISNNMEGASKVIDSFTLCSNLLEIPQSIPQGPFENGISISRFGREPTEAAKCNQSSSTAMTSIAGNANLEFDINDAGSDLSEGYLVIDEWHEDDSSSENKKIQPKGIDSGTLSGSRRLVNNITTAPICFGGLLSSENILSQFSNKTAESMECNQNFTAAFFTNASFTDSNLVSKDTIDESKNICCDNLGQLEKGTSVEHSPIVSPNSTLKELTVSIHIDNSSSNMAASFLTHKEVNPDSVLMEDLSKSKNSDVSISIGQLENFESCAIHSLEDASTSTKDNDTYLLVEPSKITNKIIQSLDASGKSKIPNQNFKAYNCNLEFNEKDSILENVAVKEEENCNVEKLLNDRDTISNPEIPQNLFSNMVPQSSNIFKKDTVSAKKCLKSHSSDIDALISRVTKKCVTNHGDKKEERIVDSSKNICHKVTEENLKNDSLVTKEGQTVLIVGDNGMKKSEKEHKLKITSYYSIFEPNIHISEADISSGQLCSNYISNDLSDLNELNPTLTENKLNILSESDSASNNKSEIYAPIKKGIENEISASVEKSSEVLISEVQESCNEEHIISTKRESFTNDDNSKSDSETLLTAEDIDKEQSNSILNTENNQIKMGVTLKQCYVPLVCVRTLSKYKHLTDKDLESLVKIENSISTSVEKSSQMSIPSEKEACIALRKVNKETPSASGVKSNSNRKRISVISKVLEEQDPPFTTKKKNQSKRKVSGKGNQNLKSKKKIKLQECYVLLEPLKMSTQNENVEKNNPQDYVTIEKASSGKSNTVSNSNSNLDIDCNSDNESDLTIAENVVIEQNNLVRNSRTFIKTLDKCSEMNKTVIPRRDVSKKVDVLPKFVSANQPLNYMERRKQSKNVFYLNEASTFSDDSRIDTASETLISKTPMKSTNEIELASNSPHNEREHIPKLRNSESGPEHYNKKFPKPGHVENLNKVRNFNFIGLASNSDELAINKLQNDNLSKEEFSSIELKKKKSTSHKKKGKSQKRLKNKMNKQIYFGSSAKTIEEFFQSIQEIQCHDMDFERNVHSLVSILNNTENYPDKSTLLFGVIKYLHLSDKNPVLAFTESEDFSVFLPPDENCITTALFRIEKEPHLIGLLSTAVTTLHHLFLSKKTITIYGLASLCRVLTEISKRRRDTKTPITLCGDLLKIKHQFAPYLIASVAGVWQELFLVEDDLSDEEVIFHSSIAYGAKQKKNLSKCNWKASMKIISKYLQARPVENIQRSIDLIMNIFQIKCNEGVLENTHWLTQALVIFAVHEDWDWTKEHVLSQYIVTNLRKFAGDAVHQKAFDVFCNLYVDVFLVDPNPNPCEEVLINFIENENSTGGCSFVEESAALALTKISLYTEKKLPRLLRRWFKRNLNNPNVAAIKSLFGRKSKSDDRTQLTVEDIVTDV